MVLEKAEVDLAMEYYDLARPNTAEGCMDHVWSTGPGDGEQSKYGIASYERERYMAEGLTLPTVQVTFAAYRQYKDASSLRRDLRNTLSSGDPERGLGVRKHEWCKNRPMSEKINH